MNYHLTAYSIGKWKIIQKPVDKMSTGWQRSKISLDFVKMNSSAYIGTLEFIFAKVHRQAVGLPVISYNHKLNFEI